MKSRILTCITAMTLFAVLAIPIRAHPAAQEQQENRQQPRYKLVDLGTLGGPSSYGDAGHSAANINNRGVAVGVADTTTPDPFYPNFNPLGFFSDPFLHHAFRTQNGTIVDLGALPGANSSSLGWISENGLITGNSLNGSIDPLTGWPEENAVLFKDGQVINLGTLGGYESQTFAINRRGQVAGFSGNAIPDPYSLLGLGTQTRAFLWDEEHGMQDLGTLGGPDAFAFGLNERGQVIGVSYPNSTPTVNCFPLVTDGFLWEDGKMVDLGSFGGTCTVPNAINNAGQVAGSSSLAGDTETHAFVWNQGTLTDIGTLGGTFGSGNAINEAADVAGGATTAGDLVFHAFLWRREMLTDLGTVAGNDCSNAFDINSRGQVVGQSFPCSVGPGGRAFLWENGRIIDLNVFVPPTSNLTLGDVEKLNDRGEIFGSALTPNGGTHAFLLIPCDGDEDGCQGENPTGVTQSSSAASTRKPPAATPANPALNPAFSGRGMLDRIRARRFPWYGVPGPATGPAN